MFRSVIAIAVIAMFATLGASSQTFKAGYVNTETIIKELPQAKEASADIELHGKRIMDTLQLMQKDFETRIEQYRKQEALMSAEAKKKEEESLNALRVRFMSYQENKNKEVQQMREDYLKPIRESVQATIAQVAKEMKLTLVLDKAAGFVLYSDDAADITFKVLDAMQRGK